MSIVEQIQRIKNNIADAYSVCKNKGAEIPQNKNCANLSSCIQSIPTSSSSSNVDLRPMVKKAWGWTKEGDGKCYFVNWNKDGTYNVMSANFKTIVKNFATNYLGSYNSYILDGDFYLRVTNTNNYIKCESEIKDWIGYSTTGSSGLAIRKNGALYSYSLTNKGESNISLIDDTGVWTKLASYYYSGTYGIRNGALCKIQTSPNSYTIIDDSGTWTDVCGLSYGVSGFGIKNGQAYYIDIFDGSSTLICPNAGFTAVSGSNYGLGICKGALYSFYSNTSAKLLDNTQTWVKIAGSYNAITSTGKLYCTSWGTSLSQVGTDSGWTDICGQSYGVAIGLKKGNVYWNLSDYNNGLKQITFSGDITEIDGVISTMSEVSRTCAVMISNKSLNQNLYTITYPNKDYTMYFDKNLTTNFPIKVNAIDSNFEYIEVLPLINGQKQRYYRNQDIDGNFNTTPTENLRTEELLNILEGL